VLRPVSRLGQDGGGRKFQHLENAPVESDKVFIYQGVSGLCVLIQIKTQQAADGIIAVEGKPVTIRCDHQKQVEKKFLLRQGGQEPVCEKTVRDEAEPARDASDAIGV